MKIKNSQVLELIAHINSIPPLQKSAKAVDALARNLKKLEKENEQIQETRSNIWKSYFGGEEKVEKTHPRYNEFLEEINKLLNLETDDINFRTFNQEDINLDNMSPATYRAISVFITDFEQ